MTAPITLPEGTRMAGNSPRTSIKTEEGGEAEGFRCILDACEAPENRCLTDITEDRDPAGPADAQTANPAWVELSSPPLPLQSQTMPLQIMQSPQPDTQAVSAAPAILAITALQRSKMDDVKGMPVAADIKIPTQPETAEAIIDPNDQDADLSNMTALPPIERHSAILGDRGPRDAERLQTQKDETPLAVSPAARNPDQSVGAPPAPASPAAQILTRIAELPNTADEQANVAQSAPLGAASTPTLPQGTAVRTLRIRLEPESLGEVEVSLRQTAGGMRVEIHVTQSTTAETLARDLGLLEDKLSALLGTSAATAAVSISLQSGSLLDTRPTSGTPQNFTQAGVEAGAPGGGSAGQRESRPEGHETPLKLNRMGTDEEEATMRSPARTGRVV